MRCVRRDRVEIREHDFDVAGKLPQDLPARAARRRRVCRVGDDGDAAKVAMAVGQRLEHRHALGADRQAVGGVLDVAAGDDRAVRRLERRADLEARVVGHRVLAARGARAFDERVRVGQ